MLTLPERMTPRRDVGTDKKVKFCNTSDCGKRNECELCENVFRKRSTLRSTTVHHVKGDLVNYVNKARDDMIADIGCPNSVISSKDVDIFVRNLSQFQQDNLEMISADEKFKFGPSGPFGCSEKLRFPIKVDSKPFWIEIAIVKADIPMLLGNNIFKPLGAVIITFPTGNGTLILGNVEIPLKETKGGHYVLKVTNLAKLCQKSHDEVAFVLKRDKCEECDESFETFHSVEEHMDNVHGRKTNVAKPILKKRKKDGKKEQRKCLNEIITALNSHHNGSKSDREKKLIEIVKDLAQMQKEEIECKLYCKLCGKPLKNESRLKLHEDGEHSTTCEECGNKETDEDNLRYHKQGEHEQHIESILMVHHAEKEPLDDDEVFQLDTDVWNSLMSEDCEMELSEQEKQEILKLHRYFAHRSGQKLWENLFKPAGTFKGKKRMVLDFLGKCKVCRKFRRTPSRPTVGLPKSKDANEVVSMDLKIFQKDGKKKKKQIGILYLHDEFTKLIKGQVINDKTKDTIVKGIEKKWIIGDGAGPGHPSRGFFSDNGGEFLNDDLIDFASTLNITIKMTAASSPWMNGSCERAHATVDKLVEKILEDDPKVDLQKAVDLACFVKNSEVNQTGFSPLQLHTGRSPTFPGLSDCSPASIDLEGSNEYIKVLRRMDHARVEARKIDCNQRLKAALKSKINPSLEQSYHFGQSVWFKIQSSHKWKAGVVLGQDGKVVFIRYGNFIRRLPLDHIVPADTCHDVEEEAKAAPDDLENDERMDDDDFQSVDIVAEKDRVIEQLKKANHEQEKAIEGLKLKIQDGYDPKLPPIRLPNLHQMICFQEAGKRNSSWGKLSRRISPNQFIKMLS